MKKKTTISVMVNDYRTPRGYSCSEWSDGLAVYDKEDSFIFTLRGVSLSKFTDKTGVIDGNSLDWLIEENIKIQDYFNTENDY